MMSEGRQFDHDGIGSRAVQDPRYTPNDMARDAQALLDKLLPLREKATGRERKQLSARIKSARILRDWAKSRAGYVG